MYFYALILNVNMILGGFQEGSSGDWGKIRQLNTEGDESL